MVSNYKVLPNKANPPAEEGIDGLGRDRASPLPPIRQTGGKLDEANPRSIITQQLIPNIPRIDGPVNFPVPIYPRDRRRRLT